jgi:hypothetical protein
MSQSTGAQSQSLNDVTLSDSRLTDDDEIGAARDELGGGEFFDLDAVDRIELPVKSFQSFAFFKMGVSDTALHGTLAGVRWPVGQAADRGNADGRRLLFRLAGGRTGAYLGR